jgi:uncharacterized protein YkwD
MSAVARFRYTLVAGVTAVVIGSGFTVVGLSRQADAQSGSPSAAGLPVAVTSPSTPPAVVPRPPAPAATTTPPRPKPTTKSPSPKATTRATKAPKKVAAESTDDSVLGQVVAHINAARAAAGLSPLTLDSKLSKASALHNQLMINGCGLEHQCPGEGGIGDRFSAQGVSWTSAGENIGFGSSGSSDADIIKAANGLTDSMLAEKPPNDGHRKNLLNTGYKKIGLSVVRDSKGITWMTQDFVN